MTEEELIAIERRADSLIESHEVLLSELVKLRKKHRLTQAEVAERMGVSQPTVAGFERYDANPTLSTVRRYALAVGAKLDERVVDDCVDSAPASVDIEAIVSGRMGPVRFSRAKAPTRVGRGRLQVGSYAGV
ncbi:helix-turn-helix domain-containing protein [Oerskovia sp. NPDC060287]|uniref:helix-turn-helix domain-containing protein n=1 Tax=Oerskovia sp. NPDC060287 TaxID=3347095 RepID=UPI00365ACC5E